jgi:hypothetical protein
MAEAREKPWDSNGTTASCREINAPFNQTFSSLPILSSLSCFFFHSTFEILCSIIDILFFAFPLRAICWRVSASLNLNLVPARQRPFLYPGLL